ncbi:polysaccharide pyruvyl transferase family protein [Pedobacter sp. AW31-3R]|uniref:polysaccharide pyruvyl transferase family protein n=1 Tax=Pedobacter sp. AW31-3R TaxID=3445781 RepID=UPI003FA010FE
MAMIIELRGVEFHNKGAELMLHAIIEKIKSKFPDVIFVMEKTPSAPRNKQQEFGIFTKTNFKLYKFPLKYVFALVPQSMRRSNYFINESEIDVVIDGSGFAFGDQWGAWKAGYRLADHIIKWKKSGKKVIMMPQALGPFTEQKLVSKMRTIIEYSDLIFARDRISFQYMLELNPNAKNIKLRPDFTNLIKGSIPSSFDPKTCEVAIIPNNKMIETASEEAGLAYVSMLKKMVEMIQDKGYKPFFLIHEGKKDLALAVNTNNSIEKKVPVVIEDNPLHVKGIIGSSKAVITSRFHGLVSCLAQAVPCLATGWSHKYEMLLEDYGYAEALVDVSSNDTILLQKLDSILDDSSRITIIEKLKKNSIEQKKLSESTWEEIFTLLNKLK